MEENIWNIECEKIISQELTEEEKQLAKNCSDIEMEFKEIISMLENQEEN